MCNAWRIKHHLLNNLEDENSCILIVWYMAYWTLWRKLVEKVKKVKIFWQERKVKAKIVKLNSFSGHADEKELLTWLWKIKKPKKIILIHWEEKAQEILEKKILEKWLSCQIAEFGVEIKL
jgi:metallo-beta-lactamase family protein